MGVDRSLLCRVELGRLSPWPKFRADAARALGIEETVLFGVDR
jgi:transcriptional regulator with XRE-family HTH domain